MKPHDMPRLLRAIKPQLPAIAIWTLAALASSVLLFMLAVGLWLFAAAVQDAGWMAAARSIDLRGVGLASGGVATMLGVAIALLTSHRKFNLFREGRPNLTIDLTATHRPVSPSYIHIGVVARLSNTSKVAIDISHCIWELYVVAPYDDHTMQRKTAAFFDRRDRKWDEPGWDWILPEVTLQLDITIEPGETDQVTFDFVIEPTVETVAITLFIPNEHYPDDPAVDVTTNASSRDHGWYRRIFHDLGRATAI